jgi:hypothetical protein
MKSALCIAAAALLVALPGCKDKKKDSEPTAAPHAEGVKPSVSPTPGSEPDLPAAVALDCARVVPDEIRAAHFPGAEVVPTIEGPIVTCVFRPPGASVSLFCHKRKRNWNFDAELARDPHKTAVKDLGRGGYLRGDHVFFYPAKLDCLARVIWPNDPAKATAVAKALDPHLSKATVSPAPSR